jgi:hypothetical protein
VGIQKPAMSNTGNKNLLDVVSRVVIEVRFWLQVEK